jgi:hypothetical protein
MASAIHVKEQRDALEREISCSLFLFVFLEGCDVRSQAGDFENGKDPSKSVNR